ncbi:hypothetical protein [Croceicoccus hydrothermalis]|uniref:hypothetical protein n=1 Tax=Croceicoccus hydrothermalis TaxID=2867964 RepID=UPI0030842AA6
MNKPSPDPVPDLPDGLFAASRLSPSPMRGAGGEWCPGMGFRGAGDIFGQGREAAAAALALALAQEAPRDMGRAAMNAAKAARVEAADDRAFLWVQDRAAIRVGGRPYLPGLPDALRHRMIHVAARDAGDALFALEEGVRCRDLAFVIGEIAGNPRALDFTASRRLVLAAERHGVPLWLVRPDARRDLGAGRMRWEVSAAPSQPPRWNANTPGGPRWHGELFRARGLRPGAWWITQDIAGHDHDRSQHERQPLRAAPAGAGDLAVADGDRSLAAASARA